MTKRIRIIGLCVMAVVAIVLAWGAWRESPGQDPDNQGGYAIVLLFLVVLLLIYVPVAMRMLAKVKKTRA